jgi:hypothetical protein
MVGTNLRYLHFTRRTRMKTMRIIVVLLLAVSVLAVVGCKEKTTPKTPPAPPSTPSAPSAPAVPDLSAAAKSVTESATTAAKAIAEKFDFDPATTVDQAKANAAKMDVAGLKSMAEACIAAVKDKQSLISTLTAQQKALPLDKMATDGPKLMEQIKQATNAMAAIKDQFKVYYDALVTKGADTAGLQMP